jgi:hypothetical protein
MFNDYSMEIARPAWQQDLGKTGRWFCCSVLLLLCLTSSPCILPSAWSDQSFAVALPELEGPVTLGIFSNEGTLVRLLCRDTPVESIPAGLNGLIMTWDEKDASAKRVSPGGYMARGIVHGALSVSALPVPETGEAPKTRESPVSFSPMTVQENEIVVRAARDALLASTPLLVIRASIKENSCMITAAGLPILSMPLPSLEKGNFPQKVRLTPGKAEGSALLTVENRHGTNSYEITGLERMVPISAGKLDVAPDAFHSSPSAGESAP